MAKKDKDWDIDALFDKANKPVEVKKPEEVKPTSAAAAAPSNDKPVRPEINFDIQKPTQANKEASKQGSKQASKDAGEKHTFEIPDDLWQDFLLLLFIQKKKQKQFIVELLSAAVEENRDKINALKNLK